MVSAPSVEHTSFTIAALPARAAYLIGAASRDGLRRAVCEASTRWGGVSEPILPVRSSANVDALWRQVLEVAAVEGLVNVDLEPELARKAAAKLGLPVVELADVDRHGATKWSTSPGCLLDERGQTAATYARAGADLWEVVAAGDLTAEAEDDLTQLRSQMRRATMTDEIGRAQLRDATLLDLGLSQLRERSASGRFPSPAVLWVTRPNSFRDCLMFWNLRALRPISFNYTPMAIVPHREVASWVGYREDVANALRRTVDVEPDLLVVGITTTDEERSSIARGVGTRKSRRKPGSSQRWPTGPPKSPPYTYRLDLDPFQRVVHPRELGTLTHVPIPLVQGRNLLQFASPARFTGAGYTLLRIGCPAFEALPKRQVVADMLVPNATWSGNALQLATNARSDYNLGVTLPSIEDAVWGVLQASTDAAQLSDKGQLGARLRELSPTPLFSDSDVLAAVKELTTPRSKELLRELEKRRSAGSDDAALEEIAATWGGRAQRRYRSATQLSTCPGNLVNAVERLVHSSFAERGLEVRCSSCGLASFVSLSQSADRPQCPACGAQEDYVQRIGPEIYYRLNALLDRASDPGVVPHVMASACLRESDARSLVLPGVDVVRGTSVAEVDLYGAFEGQMIVGEAKVSAAGFTSEQIRRDIDLCSELEADAYVMACPEELAATTVEEAAELCGTTDIDLLVVHCAEVLRF